MTASTTPRHRGFTLIELLVVIAIIALLSALAIVGALKSIKSARSATNLAKLRDLGTVMKSYTTEYGHYPPGFDQAYTQDELGPDALDWQTTRDTYPDIINAYLEKPQFSDFFLSPVLGADIDDYNGDTQPTNFTGHPALLWHQTDRNAFPELGDPALSFNRVSRPSEILLLADGVPINGSVAEECEVSIRIWATDGSVEDDREDQRDLPLNLDPPLDGQTPSRWIDFRNNGKAHVLFVDGHTEVFRPEDFKLKHVSLGF